MIEIKVIRKLQKMRTKTSPPMLQTRLQLQPGEEYGTPRFEALYGVPMQDYFEEGKPPRPPSRALSKIYRYIPVYHNGKIVWQLRMLPDHTHPSMYNFPTSSSTDRSDEDPRTSSYIARQHTRALRRIQILPSPETAAEPFKLLSLPPELRFQIYDKIMSSQTFMITSQTARGSTFTNLSYTSKRVQLEIQEWAQARPHLVPGLRGGFVDFNSTTFLVDFWSDRQTTSAKNIGSRFHSLSTEKICVGQLKDLCINIQTESQQNGRAAVMEFLRSLYATFHEFTRLQKLTIVYNSGDESVGDWFLQKGLDWTGEYEGKEGFLRTVWRMLPAALGVCHWCWPCTCCAVSWKVEVRGFDMRKGEWEELTLEREMYSFAVTDCV